MDLTFCFILQIQKRNEKAGVSPEYSLTRGETQNRHAECNTAQKVLAKHKESASPPGVGEGWGKAMGAADTAAHLEERGGISKETGWGSALQAEDSKASSSDAAETMEPCSLVLQEQNQSWP